jgi:microcystin-dependent protein
MPIDFPNSPTTGQVYTYLGTSWIWNGTGWDVPRAGSLNLENLVPPGTVTQFAGATAPTGYLLCQGQSLSTTTFGNLFNVIGYTYGGSGSSFLLPNLQNRVPVGKGPDAEFDALGETGGAKTHTLTTAEMPSHTHVQNAHDHFGSWGQNFVASGGISVVAVLPGASANYTIGATTATNQNTGGGGAHNNLQPYIVLNYIIKT